MAALADGEPAAMMSLYELVQNETADPAARRAAAEALVRAGLLRRDRIGPSPMFIWLAGLTLVIVAVGAAQSVGAWAILVFVAGAGALAVALAVLRRRGEENVYIGPTGERFHLCGSRLDADQGDTTPRPDFDGPNA